MDLPHLLFFLLTLFDESINKPTTISVGYSRFCDKGYHRFGGYGLFWLVFCV